MFPLKGCPALIKKRLDLNNVNNFLAKVSFQPEYSKT